MAGRLNPEVLAIVRQARPLIGNHWDGIIQEGAAAKDVTLAALAQELGERISRWVLDGAPTVGPAVPQLQVIEPLLRSRLLHSIIAGAVCAGVIAERLPNGHQLIGDLFKRSPARARQQMMGYSTPRGTNPVSDVLFSAGLVDRARSVRVCAVWGITISTSPLLLQLLREQIPLTTDSHLAGLMRRAESLMDRGYHIEAESYGLRAIELLDGLTLDVPIATLATLGEEEVIRRLRIINSGIANPHFAETERWLHAQLDIWQRSDDFERFKAS